MFYVCRYRGGRNTRRPDKKALGFAYENPHQDQIIRYGALQWEQTDTRIVPPYAIWPSTSTGVRTANYIQRTRLIVCILVASI